LGSIAIENAIKATGIDKSAIEEVVTTKELEKSYIYAKQ